MYAIQSKPITKNHHSWDVSCLYICISFKTAIQQSRVTRTFSLLILMPTALAFLPLSHNTLKETLSEKNAQICQNPFPVGRPRSSIFSIETFYVSRFPSPSDPAMGQGRQTFRVRDATVFWDIKVGLVYRVSSLSRMAFVNWWVVEVPPISGVRTLLWRN